MTEKVFWNTKIKYEMCHTFSIRDLPRLSSLTFFQVIRDAEEKSEQVAVNLKRFASKETSKTSN
jgi:hypothetical protein